MLILTFLNVCTKKVVKIGDPLLPTKSGNFLNHFNLKEAIVNYLIERFGQPSESSLPICSTAIPSSAIATRLVSLPPHV